jgi:hypothetical protein
VPGRGGGHHVRTTGELGPGHARRAGRRTCWKPAFARYLIPKQTGLRLDLERYLRYYNTERAHTGRWTRGRTPEEVLGKAKLWHKKR